MKDVFLVYDKSCFYEIVILNYFMKMCIRDRAAIFRRFYREEEVHDQQGVGIGLYLAREIVTRQGLSLIHISKRSSRTLDCYGYDDEMSSQFHKELAIMFDDPFERAEEERLELEREELRQCEIRKARIALSMLQPLQRERLMKNVCCGLSSRVIAKQEGVYYSSVDKSIAAAKKNFIKFYENL